MRFRDKRQHKQLEPKLIWEGWANQVRSSRHNLLRLVHTEKGRKAPMLKEGISLACRIH